MERSREIDAANIITILMEHKGYTLQQAADHTGKAFADLVQHLPEARQSFPRFGPEIDRAVSRYIDAIETWVVESLNRSFASKRYFGQASEDVENTRVVKLDPRKSELQQQKGVTTLALDQTPELNSTCYSWYIGTVSHLHHSLTTDSHRRLYKKE
jgi:hypothetical protein